MTSVLEMIEVGFPAVARVGSIEARARAELGQHRGVQRIGRHRHQHLAVHVDERAQREIDPFRGAGGDEHAIGVTGQPRRVYSAATASRADAIPGDGP